jgi:hypothetical protein
MSNQNDNPETVVWGKKVSPEFKKKVIEISKRLGTNPDYLMAIMAFETGRTFDPAQRNLAKPKNGPVGLLQFTEVGAKSIGTTKDELANKTALEQLDCVEKFLEQSKKLGLKKIEDLYAAVHWPAAVGKDVSHVLYSKHSPSTKLKNYYETNKGFDQNKDGNITLDEAAKKVKEVLAEGELYRG